MNRSQSEREEAKKAHSIYWRNHYIIEIAETTKIARLCEMLAFMGSLEGIMLQKDHITEVEEQIELKLAVLKTNSIHFYQPIAED